MNTFCSNAETDVPVLFEINSDMTVMSRNQWCVACIQAERAKLTAGLSLFTSDELFASADDSPTFDLFAPAAVSILITISFVHLYAMQF